MKTFLNLSPLASFRPSARSLFAVIITLATSPAQAEDHPWRVISSKYLDEAFTFANDSTEILATQQEFLINQSPYLLLNIDNTEITRFEVRDNTFIAKTKSGLYTSSNAEQWTQQGFSYEITFKGPWIIKTSVTDRFNRAPPYTVSISLNGISWSTPMQFMEEPKVYAGSEEGVLIYFYTKSTDALTHSPSEYTNYWTAETSDGESWQVQENTPDFQFSFDNTSNPAQIHLTTAIGAGATRIVSLISSDQPFDQETQFLISHDYGASWAPIEGYTNINNSCYPAQCYGFYNQNTVNLYYDNGTFWKVDHVHSGSSLDSIIPYELYIEIYNIQTPLFSYSDTTNQPPLWAQVNYPTRTSRYELPQDYSIVAAGGGYLVIDDTSYFYNLQNEVSEYTHLDDFWKPWIDPLVPLVDGKLPTGQSYPTVEIQNILFDGDFIFETNVYQQVWFSDPTEQIILNLSFNYNPLVKQWNQTNRPFDETPEIISGNRYHIKLIDGLIYASHDLESWSPQIEADAIAHGNEQFVAIKDDLIFTSFDGQSWEQSYATLFGESLNDITFADGVFTIVGSDRLVLQSGSFKQEVNFRPLQRFNNSWKFTEWFGWFNDKSYPWIYHQELGWLRDISGNDQNLWLNSASLGMLWTSESIYPYLWRQQSQSWIWYQPKTKPAWFYDLNSNSWFQ